MPAEQPNILFLLSDEHSYRCCNYVDRSQEREPVDTPALNSLADTGTVFQNAYCQIPLCTPSRMCLWTGRQPRAVEAWDNWSILPDSVPTLPEVLSSAGYETGLIGKMHIHGPRQFLGFDHRPYGDLTGYAGHQPDPPGLGSTTGHSGGPKEFVPAAGETEIPESLHQEQNVARESIAFLREQAHHDPDQPWFLCASFCRPHYPLTAPQRYLDQYWPDSVTSPKVRREGDTADHPMTVAAIDESRDHFRNMDEIDEDAVMKARAAYFASVSYLDEIIGELLATMDREGLLENTIIIYSSDHGEMAGEHGFWEKLTWHEASTHVPLLFQLPEQRAGTETNSRLSTPVSLADIFPTICGFADVEAPTSLDGADLSENIRNGSEPDRPPVVCDNLSPNWGDGTEYRMVREDQYKYVGFADYPELLFDLEKDPFEQTNLAADPNEEHKAVLERLRDIVDKSIDFDAAIDERTEEMETREDRRLGLPGRRNAYQMKDGRIIDADTPLYKPDVLVRDPSKPFSDWPDPN